MKNLTGKQIKKRREEHDLTQKELGEKVGCKSSYLSFIEGGFVPETGDLIERITALLSKEPSAEVKKLVADKKAAAKARAVAKRRKEAKAKS